MTMPVIMHVNYCEQGQTLEEICRKAVGWGFDGVEFRRKRSDGQEEVEEYLDALASAVDKAGLEHVILGSPGPNLMAKEPAEREREIHDAVAFYRSAARRFRLSVCNTFTGPLKNPDPKVPCHEYDRQGSAVATDEHWAWAVEGFKVMGDLAVDLGFRFAFETHMTYLHDLPAVARQLVDRIDRPAVGVNLDYGTAVYFTENKSLRETVAELGGSLYYTHLKNSMALDSGGRISTALSQGDINHREYVGLLMEAGYDGPLCIEAPRAGDREWYAQQDLAYIRSVIAECAESGSPSR